jgi:hypothetical protein
MAYYYNWTKLAHTQPHVLFCMHTAKCVTDSGHGMASLRPP